LRTQPENAKLGYSDTPLVPGTPWHIHDGTRPQPRVVTPADGGKPPSDAVVLFNGTSLDGWVKTDGGAPAAWKVENGYAEVVPGTGNIQTRASFGSVQLHLEFASPAVVKGEGQGRGNSGVFLQAIYEIQVLDNWQNPTYADGLVGALYGQYPPLVNSIRSPGQWNAYDILWTAPVFDGEKLVRPAFVTVLLNGVALQVNRELMGITWHKTVPAWKAHPARGPLMLQDHGDLVRFRNIWLREIVSSDE
jgi:hypothetical protein